MQENERMLAEFMELSTTDAASRQERAIADRLISKLTAMGFTVTEDGVGAVIGGDCGNLLAVREGERGGSLLFSSHMDRVPNGFGICPVERDGYLYSDGSTILAADDLSGVCAILSGVRRAIASGEALPRIEILFTVGEEAGLLGSRNADLSALQSRIGYVFDSPGATGRFIKGAPSICKLEAVFHGKASHAGSAPEKGVDAAKAMALALSRLETGRLDWESTANFPGLETNTHVTNVVCSYARMYGETRSHNRDKVSDYMEKFEKTCLSAASETGATVEITVDREMYPFYVDENEPILRAAKRACESMGITCTIESAGGGMDANILNEKGIMAVGVGTGYAGNHTTSERLSVADFYRAGELAKTLILQYQE